jgi:hypothetical protein
MANWMTTAEISARYIVGEQKLLAYAHRGNMPMFRGPDGIVLFDESFAAQLFRPRDPAAAVAVTAPSGKPNLGILGVMRMGDQPDAAAAPASMRVPVPVASPQEPTLSLRQAHRRALRGASTVAQPEAPMRKAAG